MCKYRKKPVVIEAFRFDGRILDTPQWYRDACRQVHVPFVDDLGDHAEIHTLEGVMTARIGDWVIKGVKGELYPCKDDIFQATYEKDEEKELPSEWPVVGSTWVHTSGRKYMIVEYTNVENDPAKRDRYPVTIIYRNLTTGKLYSRRLDDWERSFKYLLFSSPSQTV